MENEHTKSNVENTLNLKIKLQQKTVLKAISEIDWNASSASPLVVEFDPTTACNLACPDCINRDLLNQGLFTRKRIKELAQEMVSAGVKAIVLIGGGEPLMHPEIGWLIEYFGKNGIQLGLTTNGTLINKYAESIAEYTSWVRVSVDAGTPEVYNKIRPSVTGKSEFENIIKNMEAFAKIKKGKLGYSFMIYSSGMFNPDKISIEAPLQLRFNPEKQETDSFTNVDDILTAARLAKEIGCDYCEIKPMYDANHYLILQDAALMDRAKFLSEEAKKLETDTFKVLFATKLPNLFDGKDNMEIKNYTRCAVAQLRTLVTPSGVYVCPYFRGRDDMRLGNVMHQSFKEMWDGERRKAVLERLNPVIHCKMHCIRHESNLIIEDMIAEKLKLQPVDDFDLFI